MAATETTLKQAVQGIASLTDGAATAQAKIYGAGSYAELSAVLADPTIDKAYLLKDIELEAIPSLDRAIDLLAGETPTVGTAVMGVNTIKLIDGRGNAVTFEDLDATQYMAIQIQSAGVTINDLEIDVSGDSDVNALYCIDVNAAGSTIEDCTLSAENEGSASSVAVCYETGAEHVLKNNTLMNGVALTGSVSFAEISGNIFAAEHGFGLGACNVGGYAYNAESHGAAVLANIKAFLLSQGNRTTGDATSLLVEGYYEE